MRYILASSSPRRKELLNLIGIKPHILIPRVNEEQIPGEKLPDFLERVTIMKGESIMKDSYRESIVISSDTVVVLNNRIIGKPENRQEAFEILKQLSGEKHEVWTGICLLFNDSISYEHTGTQVYFDNISHQAIDYYLDNEVYLDKAGAYAIQGKASVFIKKIDGCFFNVMGFPLHLFARMVKKLGIELYGS